jgi:hypothetical protein
MNHPPAIEKRDDEIAISFSSAPAARRARFECILDVDDLGDLTGIEILSFRKQLAATLPESPGYGWPRWAIDDEIDAFYLHLREGRAGHQEKAQGSAHIGDRGELTSLWVPRGRARSDPPQECSADGPAEEVEDGARDREARQRWPDQGPRGNPISEFDGKGGPEHQRAWPIR